MYDYYLFDNSNGCYNYNNRFSCRELLIRKYAETTITVFGSEVFYFGHATNFRLGYKEVIDEVWKGQVPYEIVLLKDIQCFSYDLYGHQRKHPNTQLVKIGNNIHPPDISLILYITGFGKTFGVNSRVIDYFFAKKYSDLIPNFYTEYNNAKSNYNTNANGPETYIYRLANRDYTLVDRMHKLYLDHIDEWELPLPLTNTHTYLRHFLRYPKSNIIIRNNATRAVEVWIPANSYSTENSIIREFRGNYYTYRNNFRGRV